MRTTFVALLLFLSALSPSLVMGQSNAHWIEVRSPHFVVMTDSNEKQGRRIAVQFEQMRAVFHTLIPNATGDSGATITVLALKDRKGFVSLEPAEYMAKGQLDLAGYFLRTQDKDFILVRLDAEGEQHPFATVYHEYTHVMLSKAPWVPLWMNEGLAEFYQNTDILDKYVLMGQPSADNILYLREHSLIPLTTLLKVDYQSPYYHDEQKGSVFYAESWALMHYIEMTDYEKKENRLKDYAVHLIDGEDSVTAAQHAFGDLKALEGSLDMYVRQMSFKEFKLSMAFPVDPALFTARPMPTPDADAVRAEVLVGNNRTKDAEALLTACLHDDPNSAAAHEAMGTLRFRAGDIAGAERWYGEAVKLGSQSYLAHYYFGAMALQDNDREHDAEVEESLRTAMKLKPDFAPSYDALARFYAVRDERLTEAHTMTLQAVGLDPSNVGYRINAANVLVKMKNLNGAETVLMAALKVAKRQEETLELQIHLEQLAQYRAAVEGAQKREESAQVTSTTVVTGAPSATGSPNDANAKTLVFKKVNGQMIGTEGAEAARRYPEGEATGARHVVNGTIRGVECSYPSVIAFHVEQKGKTVALYSNNFYKIAFTTANYTSEKPIMPCTEIEGMSAKVGYAEVTDERVAGQAVSIELSK